MPLRNAVIWSVTTAGRNQRLCLQQPQKNTPRHKCSNLTLVELRRFEETWKEFSQQSSLCKNTRLIKIRKWLWSWWKKNKLTHSERQETVKAITRVWPFFCLTWLIWSSTTGASVEGRHLDWTRLISGSWFLLCVWPYHSYVYGFFTLLPKGLFRFSFTAIISPVRASLSSEEITGCCGNKRLNLSSEGSLSSLPNARFSIFHLPLIPFPFCSHWDKPCSNLLHSRPGDGFILSYRCD